MAEGNKPVIKNKEGNINVAVFDNGTFKTAVIQKTYVKKENKDKADTDKDKYTQVSFGSLTKQEMEKLVKVCTKTLQQWE